MARRADAGAASDVDGDRDPALKGKALRAAFRYRRTRQTRRLSEIPRLRSQTHFARDDGQHVASFDGGARDALIVAA
jgi:hypothetical protein